MKQYLFLNHTLIPELLKSKRKDSMVFLFSLKQYTKILNDCYNLESGDE